MKLPTIATMKVRPEAIDEWYGVNVQVTWTEPFDDRAFAEATHAESTAWFAAHPGRAHVGLWPLERALHAHVVAQVLKHPAWVAFWAAPRTVEHEQYDGGPLTRTRLPRFTADDFDNWDYGKDGGWLSASTRD